MRTKFLSEKLNGREHLEDLVVEGRIVLELILGGEVGCEVVDWFMWLSIGASNGLLCTL
jgi:hypothetical protein